MWWVAEGFIRPSDQFKCLEDVGECYLEDLVNRSLILVSKKGSEGKIKTVRIHDPLREICVRKAEEEGFLHQVSSKVNAQIETIGNTNRRVGIHFHWTRNLQEWHILDSSIRSVLLFFQRYLGSSISLSCRHLCILHAIWPNFSDIISAFVNLRYIAFALNDSSCPHGFPASISKLPNLQTIITHVTQFRGLQVVPCEIWEMPKLRHLIIDTPFQLSCPYEKGLIHESDLQTLGTLLNFKFTEESVKRLTNLKNLEIMFFMGHHNLDDFGLNNLFRLQNLEYLLVTMLDYPCPSRIWNHAFPINLKQLHLCDFPLPWGNMTIIGLLPNLQVLKMLKIDVAEESEWTPVEGQFLQLRYFLDYLVKWEVEKEHFPRLESLILWRALWIEEIPRGIGEIDSLQLIELKNCSELLVDSAKRIEQQQHENGNYAFQVRFIDCMSSTFF